MRGKKTDIVPEFYIDPSFVTKDDITFDELYNIIDGWYHKHTRFHLVDVDEAVFTNLLKPLLERINNR